MHIDRAIEVLQKMKADGSENIVLAAWDAQSFDLEEGSSWEIIAEYIEQKMDWANTHDQMSNLIDTFEE